MGEPRTCSSSLAPSQIATAEELLNSESGEVLSENWTVIISSQVTLIPIKTHPTLIQAQKVRMKEFDLSW